MNPIQIHQVTEVIGRVIRKFAPAMICTVGVLAVLAIASLAHAGAAMSDGYEAARAEIEELRSQLAAWRADIAGSRDLLLAEVRAYADDPTSTSAREDLMAAIDGFRESIMAARSEYQDAMASFVAARREVAASQAADAEERIADLRAEIEDIRAERFSEFCSRYESAGEVPEGYGAAADVAGGSGELLVSARCDVASGDYTVELGDGEASTYVYETGYRWDRESGSWEELEFESLDGDKVGDWIPGEAFADFPAEHDDMGEPQFVAGYTCQRIDDEWKCGCQDAACDDPRWQLQSTVPSIENQEISESVTGSMIR